MLLNLRKLAAAMIVVLLLPFIYVPLHAQAPDGTIELVDDALVQAVEEADEGYEVTNLSLRQEALSPIIEQLKGKTSPRMLIKASASPTADSAVLHLTSEQVALLQRELPGLTVDLSFRDVIYHQPLDWIQLDVASRLLSAPADGLRVLIEIHYAAGEHQYPMERLARSLGMSLFSLPVYFTVSVQSGEQELVLDTYGNQFAERTFQLSPTAANQPLTAVRYDWSTHELQFVPALIDREGGTVQAIVKSNINSPIFIGRYAKSFADTASHWAKEEIEQLASRLLIRGTGERHFSPDRAISRAEFAALLVRAVGASPDQAASPAYRDVNSADWYHDAVKAANASGLVEGFENGEFRPNSTITREQMAAMIIRAMDYLGVVNDKAAGAGLERFSDHKAIQGWAREAVSQAAAAGIITGMEDGSFRPGDTATRAQAAVMLQRFLQQVGFMEG
ncbi:S-layer homology domain-containing protein [Paenibacillus senegalensis]|uniref:S-layer homology domain-containing protein n=1 Tax=Paenibacillus senegalensis TaxID=1465766 RepID=UPI00028935F8|nr:S-layer homology domain-containing protein [Paenibacillus senegalensis]